MLGDQSAIDQRYQIAVAIFAHLTETPLPGQNFASMGA
jgi:hypothetical protein